ncbi:IS1/IS1595 family N-terminal zinc-binding domain-containing protein [Persephonella hydrogeniphila]|uniref:IS1/IS1595 family N-terminal zinc-binding domain-containing protein n=1 Tax=Persephonella hydrogeniphila TaxID=198703 RepID=UPI003CCBBE5B
MLNHNVICPNCGASRCIKNGRVNGKQTYLCKECFSRFSTDRVRRRYSKETKNRLF